MCVCLYAFWVGCLRRWGALLSLGEIKRVREVDFVCVCVCICCVCVCVVRVEFAENQESEEK